MCARVSYFTCAVQCTLCGTLLCTNSMAWGTQTCLLRKKCTNIFLGKGNEPSDKNHLSDWKKRRETVIYSTTTIRTIHSKGGGDEEIFYYAKKYFQKGSKTPQDYEEIVCMCTNWLILPCMQSENSAFNPKLAPPPVGQLIRIKRTLVMDWLLLWDGFFKVNFNPTKCTVSLTGKQLDRPIWNSQNQWYVMIIIYAK